jgi:phage terminase large subunit
MKTTELSNLEAAKLSIRTGEIVMNNQYTFLPHGGAVEIGSQHLGDKFSGLVQNDTKYALIQGGRASGKSYTTSLLITLLTYEKEQVILYTRYTMASASSSIIAEFNSRIEDLGLQDDFEVTQKEIINKVSGSRVMFKGFKTGSQNQTASLKSLEGLTMLVVEEAEELASEEDFNKVVNSIRTTAAKNRVWLILNAGYRAHWIHDRFFKPNALRDEVSEKHTGTIGNTAYVYGSYLDIADKLSEEFIQETSDLQITNPAKYKHVFLGEWINLAEGTIFTNWELGEYQAIRGGEILGVDFGFSDATAGVLCSVDKSNGVIYMKQAIYGEQFDSERVVQEIEDFYRSEGLDRRAISCVCDSARPELIASIRKKGVKGVPSKKGAGSVLDGIDTLKDYKFIVDKDSTDLIESLQKYKWKSNVNKDAPHHDFSHFCDAFRYASVMKIKSFGSYSLNGDSTIGERTRSSSNLADDYVSSQVRGDYGKSGYVFS